MTLRAQCESARHRHAPRMTDAELPTGHSQRRGGLCRPARESDFRRRARRAADHHIGEGNPRPEAGANRLEHRFLGSEPPRQTLNPIDPIADLVQLGLHEATWNQRVARILNPAPHLSDIHQINAVSDNVHRIRLSLSRHVKAPPTLGNDVMNSGK